PRVDLHGDLHRFLGRTAVARLMAFIDGENLTTRFEEMVKEGRAPRERAHQNNWLFLHKVEHDPGRFVWSRGTVRDLLPGDEITRAHYYTTFAGAPAECEALAERIAGFTAAKFDHARGFE